MIKKSTKEVLVLMFVIISVVFISCAPSSVDSAMSDRMEAVETIETIETIVQDHSLEHTVSLAPEMEEPEVVEELIVSPPSYAEQCALDYVEQPKKRSRSEAIEKLKELSVQFPKLAMVVENEKIYPDGVLTSVANNPEMTDFVCGYQDSNGSVTGGFTKEEMEQDYPRFLQWDIRWGYFPYGMTVMGDSGCGPTCLSMAIFYLTRNEVVTPDVVGKYSMENGYYVTDVGTAWTLLDDYPKLYDLSTSKISVSQENMKNELDEGNILICSMRPGNFTAGGHFVVVYEYDENGFKVNDPKCVYRSRQDWSYEDLATDIKQIWVIGK